MPIMASDDLEKVLLILGGAFLIGKTDLAGRIGKDTGGALGDLWAGATVATQNALTELINAPIKAGESERPRVLADNTAAIIGADATQDYLGFLVESTKGQMLMGSWDTLLNPFSPNNPATLAFLSEKEDAQKNGAPGPLVFNNEPATYAGLPSFSPFSQFSPAFGSGGGYRAG